MAIILDGTAGSCGHDIQDLGRVSEALLKAMSLGQRQFVAIDGVEHASQQQQPKSISNKHT